MSRAKVAVLYTKPETVLADTHRLMNLADYQQHVPKDNDTALKINISWHYFFPACSTTPSFNRTIRSARVIASIWSWVT